MFFKRKTSNSRADAGKSARQRNPAEIQGDLGVSADHNAVTENQIPSILAGNLHIAGKITSTGEVQAACSLEGSLDVNHLTIEEDARIAGSLVSDKTTIRGRVFAEVISNDVCLEETARTKGRIRHKALSVKNGARLESDCRHSSDPKVEFALKSKRASRNVAANTDYSLDGAGWETDKDFANDMSPSIFASDMEVEGEIVSFGAVHIDGRVTGSVKATLVVIGKGARVSSAIECDDIIVHGEFDGILRAKSVRLAPDAVVGGDVFHKVLVVDEGARLTADCICTQEPFTAQKPRSIGNVATEASEPQTGKSNPAPKRTLTQKQTVSPSKPLPTTREAYTAFRHMPENNDLELRNKALFGFLLASGLPAGAAITLNIGDLDTDNHLVRVPLAKKVGGEAWKDKLFALPAPELIQQLQLWVTHLKMVRRFGDNDPLFPQVEVASGEDGRFKVTGLKKLKWAETSPIRRIVGDAFEAVECERFGLHALKKTSQTGDLSDLLVQQPEPTLKPCDGEPVTFDASDVVKAIEAA